MLSEKLLISVKSSIYETKPWGFVDQPDFLNQVLKCETNLTPTQLLDYLKRIEREMGRENNFRYGPRLIDLDILFLGDRVIHTSRLDVPHLKIPERAFVLVPLEEIAPNLIHPVSHKTIRELMDQLIGKDEVRLCK